MKVKIGDIIYDSEDEPIVLILADTDKSNIANMLPEATKFCSAPASMTHDEIREFMKTE